MAAVCPMCHAPAGDNAKECEDCGYEYGQSLMTLRGMLRRQLLNYRAMFWAMALSALALLISIYWLASTGAFLVLPLGMIAFLGWQAAYAARKISVSKQSLAMVASKEAALPKATLISE